MPLNDDNGAGGTCITWTIHNFSYYFHKFQRKVELESPIFALNSNIEDKWRLQLIKSRYMNSEHMSLVLNLNTRSNLQKKICVRFALSIGNNKRLYNEICNLTKDFTNGDSFGCVNILRRHAILEKGDNPYLEADKLTLSCRIWQVGEKILDPVLCNFQTIIIVNKITQMWSFENVQDKIEEKLLMSSDMPSFDVDLSLIKSDTFSGNKIKLDIKRYESEKCCFSTCDLALMEIDGKIINSIRDEKWFDESNVSQSWTPPLISLNKMSKGQKLLLRHQLTVSYGEQYSWIDRIEIENKMIQVSDSSNNVKKQTDFTNGQKDDLHVQYFTNGLKDDLHVQYFTNGLKDDLHVQYFTNGLKDDLHVLYSEGTFSDMIVRTSNKDFPVHKNILGARSEVFKAMFEQDMKENITGVMEIKDIDDNIISKMLLFVYTDTFKDMDCNVACKLYFAADKYRIMALRRNCSDFIEKNVDTSNAYDALVLANTHQDENLETFVKNFIMDHASEIIDSEEWKIFAKDHMSLAYELMHMLCIRNLKK